MTPPPTHPSSPDQAAHRTPPSYAPGTPLPATRPKPSTVTDQDGAHTGTRPRVLIIRPSALGDVSRTVPALVTLRHAMPDAQIDWLVSEAFAPVIRHHPALDHVVSFPRRRFASIGYNPRVAAEALAWARSLRARRYDLVFDLQGLLRSGLFAKLTGATQRVGFANARELAWLGYNRRHHVNTCTHTVDRMLALLQAEGHTPSHDTRLYLADDDKSWLDRWLQDHNGDGLYTCIAPIARWRCKCWPIENYLQIARRLLDTGKVGSHIVIITAPQERPHAQLMIDAFADNPNVLFPQTTVGQMMALISHASLMVCNDSAPLHIAVGFDRPIAAIFGPTDPALVGPYRRDDTVVRPPAHAMPANLNYRKHRDDQTLIAKVAVDEVWDRVLSQINRPPIGTP